jgi:hypothetical protein
MTQETKQQWDPRKLLGKHVLYLRGKFIGRVTDFFDGVTRKFVSSINQQTVKGPVLQLDAEHHLIATEANFIELNEGETAFFTAIQKALTGALAEMVKVGAELKIPPQTLALLLTATLRTQCMALEAFHKNDVAPQAPPETAFP